MRILNEQDVEIQAEDVDYELGYLTEDKIFKEHHEATEAKERITHYYPLTYYFEDGTEYKTELGLFRAAERETLSDDPLDEENNKPTQDVAAYETDERVVKNDDGVSFGITMEDGSVAQCGDTVLRGVDVEEIVDQEEVKAKEAWDEYEDIQRYRLYTEEELIERATDRANMERYQAEQTQAVSFMRMMAAPMALSMTDEAVQQIATFLPDFEAGQSYENKAVVRYKGALYRAIQAVGSSVTSIYTPDAANSYWKRVGEPNEDGIYPWTQPLGATDAYMKGDVVEYKGVIYESTMDNNVWSPDAYSFGWKKVEGEVSGGGEEGGTDTEYPDFVQPTGGHDAYHVGDKVTYNGKHYESTIDNNVWTPDAYPQGWKEV